MFKVNKCLCSLRSAFATAILLFSASLSAQNNLYPISAIPDSLKKNASAIVRLNKEEFVQENLENATLKITLVVTILDKMGDRFANFGVSCDKFREIRDFSGVVRDNTGKVVKKIKKGDLTNSSIDFGSMATDNYSLMYQYQSLAYPFTVEYSYQLKLKNGVLWYPSFTPYLGTGIAVEKSSLSLEIPVDVDLRYRSNYDSNIRKQTVNGKTVYLVSMDAAKAIVNEKFMPPSYESYPSVQFAPNAFCYDGHCGDMSTWNSYGLWVAELLKNRDTLPVEEVSKLKELAANAEMDREKVQILYKYLQDNTRYVSIQLGIGGFQPFPASSVSKSRYGDCKGLTNLMKAMLKAVGIQSNYCEIYSGDRKDLSRDFASISQTNHAILLVPLLNDSIWLECTSQTLPFAFVHEDIAGHDVLVVSEDGSGGKICQLPAYTDSENKAVTSLSVDIDENGMATGNVEFNNSAYQHQIVSYFIRSNDREKQLKFINGMLKLPNIEVGDISSSEDFTNIPNSRMQANFVAKDFANKTGTRLFIPICPLDDRDYTYFSSDKRTFDVDIDDGSTTIDSLIFTIPKGYVVESLPKTIDLSTDFGSYVTSAVQDGNKIVYTQKILVPSARYGKDKYADLKDFFAKITSGSKRKVVLKKE